ncbi:glycoside hydrolase [Blastopirellula sp. JC732]|uniref:Glycoside hydrolase n=1 Tax=Blastopirellula sediminis TaxID=2894196 RepID=A0A9X1SIT8_9BACT|nr:sialidase family protein [Blastopirellula sediminis]MCC9605549.1 glycoside hydrolase [Blastopirellula sediminis]MCC9631151.1 glycoside hydrolase [Blastopirellula sediminis]
MSTAAAPSVRVCLALLVVSSCASLYANESPTPCVTIVHREVTPTASPIYKAIYVDAKNNRLAAPSWQSDDNGQTWAPLRSHQALAKDLTPGFRRNPTTMTLDESRNCVISIVNALDTPELDPTIAEPPIAQQTYYLRYRLSLDGGRSWLCDDPIVGVGDFDAMHPFADLWIGKNAIYLGDNGCAPIVTKSGRVLVPAQMTVLDEQGQLYKPPRAHTYTEAAVLIGEWTAGDRLAWRMAPRVAGDITQTVRGLIEPTIAEMPDGRILMVMRGSNSHDPSVAATKWCSVSSDDGETWSKPQRWTYDDGTSFYSPSSMCVLMRHSSGRVFWVGNITPENPDGNLPRFPLAIGEVDPQTLGLIRSSVVIVDQKSEEDEKQGRLDLSHVHLMEDRETGELILTYPRAHHSYREREFALLRLSPSSTTNSTN